MVAAAQRIGKPKNQRTKRLQKARESKIVENGKTALVMKGLNSSQIVNDMLNDIASMKKPLVKKLTKKNETRPFEDQGSVEFLSRMNDASLFVFGSHSKKRAHNLILGRCFDHQMLDMFEFGIDPTSVKTIQSMQAFKKAVVHAGSKPLFVFAGEEFELNPDMGRFKNFVLDFFHGEFMEKLNLAGIDRVIVCTSVNDKVLFRQYAISFKKSGTSIPNVKLEEMGPRMDLTLRRTMHAAEAVQNDSRRMPKVMKSNTQRGNVEKGLLGQTLGRVHMQRQDMTDLALRKMKGLKKSKTSTDMDVDANEDAA